MTFKLTIGGEVIKELDIEQGLIAAVNIGSYRIPVNVDEMSLDIGIEYRPHTDAELVEQNIRVASAFLEEEYNQQLEDAGVRPPDDVVTPEERDLRRSLEAKSEEAQEELDRVANEKDSDLQTGLIRDDGSDPHNVGKKSDNTEDEEFSVEEEHENEFA